MISGSQTAFISSNHQSHPSQSLFIYVFLGGFGCLLLDGDIPRYMNPVAVNVDGSRKKGQIY